MPHHRLFILTALLAAAATAQAGTLSNGQWSSTGCGDIPEQPVLDTSGTLDQYNQSVNKVNEWQQLVQTYMACVVIEANTDNEAIAKAANEQKAKFKEAIEKIKADAAASPFVKNK
ncbi:MAG: hypothetical protein Q7U57_19690 [Methylovulum sp.]|nr:hypothetical protein [Methylovulum sp.]